MQIMRGVCWPVLNGDKADGRRNVGCLFGMDVMWKVNVNYSLSA